MEEQAHHEEHSSPIITESTAEELDNVFENKETESIEKVEAALFIAGRFLNLQELIMLTDVNPIMLKEILHRLEKKYATGVLRLINRSNSWKMDVIEKYHYLINKLATGNAEFTKAEQETLAIIAYKQPIKQSVIINIRGNKSYDHIRKFRDLGLVVAKKSGHTLDLSLSEEFYEYFNVHNNNDSIIGEDKFEELPADPSPAEAEQKE
ncbi:MAG: SMC-Scp complex subunit ScpB [Nanoarchaeota archaeon]|nr:SMC-Scp complex subunit ScpB [Nanoarchaeota archaeon]